MCQQPLHFFSKYFCTPQNRQDNSGRACADDRAREQTVLPVLRASLAESAAAIGDGVVTTARRPNTQLLTLDAGHVTHHDAPAEFTRAVKELLARVTT